MAVEVSTAFGNAVVLRLGLLSLEWGDSVIFPVLRENAVFLRVCDSERVRGGASEMDRVRADSHLRPRPWVLASLPL